MLSLGVNKLWSKKGDANDYSALGVRAPLVADFEQEYYRKSGGSTSLTTMMTHTATTNATMTDGDGLIKWRPHNLLTYSEEFDNAAWIFSTGTRTANYALAPDGTLTADRIQLPASAGTYVAQTSPVIEGLSYTVSFWVKATSGTSFFDIYVDGASTVQKGTQTATNEWQLFTFTFTASLTNSSVGINNGNDSYASDILVWGAHLYRSDLGGMVDNPERGDSYVPTAAQLVGPELVTNGTFDTDVSGWTIGGAGATFTYSSGQAILSRDGTSATSQQNITTVVGKHYIFSCDLTATTGSAKLGLQAGSVANTSSPEIKTHSISFTATSTTTTIILHTYNTVSGTLTLDNITVRETLVNPSVARYLPRTGHHIYNGYEWVNEGLLHESEARTNLVPTSAVDASWSTTNVSVIYNDALSPDGNQNATKITETTVTSNFYTACSNASFTAGQVYTNSAIVKAGTRTFVQLLGTSVAFGPGVYANFDLSDGTIGFQGSGVSQATIEPLGNGWYRCSVTGAATTTIAGPAAFVILVPSKTAARAQTYTGSTSNYLYAYSAQIEAGSTPSSYIPTNGAAVTRAVESLSIPAANLPYPAPVYTGPELVTNGTFDTDVSGWSSGNGAILFANNGKIKIENTAASGYAYQQITTVAGNVYAITADFYFNALGGYLRLGSSTGTTNGITLSQSGNYTVYFLADDTTTFAKLQVVGGSSGDFVEFDNISVREINPLSVSIQMAGRMTYADENIYSTLIFSRWRKDSDNYIQHDLSTNSTDTGRVFFGQESGGVYDQVNSAIDFYNPDINVPFNISGRHGSTFVNGAADGIALTADTTPVALPDLSATPLSLGYDYMGTISQFRMWDKDIGDTGIVEVTSPSLEPTLSLSFDETASSYTNTNWSE